MERIVTPSPFPRAPSLRFWWLAASLAALLAALVPAFASGADAGRFIESIYAHGHEDRVWSQWLQSARRGAWLSRDLTALWNRCDARARRSKDAQGALDFDIATNSQLGWESFKGYAVRVVSLGASRSVVDVRLQNGANTVPRKFDSDNVIRYDLVQESGAWKIDDVHSTVDAKPWALRELLKDYLKN
jgi:hypothetical protein